MGLCFIFFSFSLKVYAAVTPPAAPTNLTWALRSSTQIDLGWSDNANNETGFKLERSTNASFSAATVIDVPANPNFTYANMSYSDTGLTPGTTYYYRVRAYNSAGYSAYSITITVAMPQTKPAPPSIISGQADSPTQITLNLADNSNNESGFNLERSTNASFTNATVFNLGANSTTVFSFRDTNLLPGTSYYYRIYAYNSAGNSAYSNVLLLMTPSEITPPLPPSSFNAQAVSANQIDLSWQHYGNNIVGFKIKRGLSSSSLTLIATLTSATRRSYSDTGLRADTIYYYQICSYSSSGNSAYTNVVWKKTLKNPPLAPSALSGRVISSTNIQLEWLDNSDNEEGFYIERSANGSTTILGAGPNNISWASYNDTGLIPNTDYTYRVAAYNSGGTSDYSPPFKIATVAPVNPPENLQAVAKSPYQIELTWEDKSDNEEGFLIVHYPSKDKEIGIHPVDAVGANINHYTNAGLLPQTSYDYEVYAYNKGFKSASIKASATTPLAPPDVPTNLSATAKSSTEIELKWYDNFLTADGYIIERSFSPDSWSDALIIRDLASTRFNGEGTYADKGLTANTTYYYRVYALNMAGKSDYSNTARTTTSPLPPAKPSNLQAIPKTTGEIELSWKDNADNEQGFKVFRAHDNSGSCGIFIELADIKEANAQNYTDYAVLPQSAYYYKVYAYNLGGKSDDSDTAKAKTFPRPAKPQDLKAVTDSTTAIELSWTDTLDNDESGYKILRSENPFKDFVEVDDLAQGDMEAYFDTKLTPATTYYYQVRAYLKLSYSDYPEFENQYIYSEPSNIASATTDGVIIRPRNLTATAQSASQIDLKWDWDESPGKISAFKIKRGAFPHDPLPQVIAQTGPTDKAYTDKGLEPLQTYYYKVSACTPNGNSLDSDEASATTMALPHTPEALTAEAISSTQIDLKWRNAHLDTTGYEVERKTETTDFVKIETLPESKNEYTYFNDLGLTPNTTYFYRVRAVNKAGYSDYSNTDCGITPPLPENKVLILVDFDPQKINIGDFDPQKLDPQSPGARTIRIIQDYPEVAPIKLVALKWKINLDETIKSNEVDTDYENSLSLQELPSGKSTSWTLGNGKVVFKRIYSLADMFDRNFLKGKASIYLDSYLDVPYRPGIFALVKITFAHPEKIAEIQLGPNQNMLVEKGKGSLTIKIPQYIDQRKFVPNKNKQGLSFIEGKDGSADVIQWMGFDIANSPASANIILGNGADGKPFTVKDMFSYVPDIVVQTFGDESSKGALARVDSLTRVVEVNSKRMADYRLNTRGVNGYSGNEISDFRAIVFAHEFHHVFHFAACSQLANSLFGENPDKDRDTLLAKNYFSLFYFSEDSEEKGYDGDIGLAPGAKLFGINRQERVFPFKVAMPTDNADMPIGINITPIKMNFLNQTAYLKEIKIYNPEYVAGKDPLTKLFFWTQTFEPNRYRMNDDLGGCIIKEILWHNDGKRENTYVSRVALKLRRIFQSKGLDPNKYAKVSSLINVRTIDDPLDYDAEIFAEKYYEQLNKP